MSTQLRGNVNEQVLKLNVPLHDSLIIFGSQKGWILFICLYVYMMANRPLPLRRSTPPAELSRALTTQFPPSQLSLQTGELRLVVVRPGQERGRHRCHQKLNIGLGLLQTKRELNFASAVLSKNMTGPAQLLLIWISAHPSPPTVYFHNLKLRVGVGGFI